MQNIECFAFKHNESSWTGDGHGKRKYLSGVGGKRYKSTRKVAWYKLYHL